MDNTAVNDFIDPLIDDFWRCIADIVDQQEKTKEIKVVIDAVLENEKNR
jgi:hypothetical protein